MLLRGRTPDAPARDRTTAAARHLGPLAVELGAWVREWAADPEERVTLAELAAWHGGPDCRAALRYPFLDELAGLAEVGSELAARGPTPDLLARLDAAAVAFAAWCRAGGPGSAGRQPAARHSRGPPLREPRPMPRPTLTWSTDPAAGSHAQAVTIARGEDVALSFAPATAGEDAPDAIAFTVAAEPEGDAAFAELTVGDGVTIDDQDAGEFTVAIPAAVTAEIDAGEYVWSVWGLDSGAKAALAGGTMRVVATARSPG